MANPHMLDPYNEDHPEERQARLYRRKKMIATETAVRKVAGAVYLALMGKRRSSGQCG